MFTNKQQTKTIYLAADKKMEHPFQIGTIDHITTARLIDSNMEVKQGAGGQSLTVFHTDEQLLLFAKCGLKAWPIEQPAPDSVGAQHVVPEIGVHKSIIKVPLKFEEVPIFGNKQTVVTDESLALLNFADVLEIGRAVKDFVTITDEEIKNS